MGLLNQEQNQGADLAENEKKQEELNKKLRSIFPYFKQLLPSDENSKTETLPNDIANMDRQKTYSIPGISLIIKNICDDLNCLYAYDNGVGLDIIQESELEKLNISKEQLHEIAMANYRQFVSQNLNAQNNGEAFWFILDGNLEAGLVLIDEIWEQIAGYLQEELVISVPARDVLLATGKSNEKVIADFSEKAKQILTNGDHPLSKNWFIRKNKEWKVFRKIMD